MGLGTFVVEAVDSVGRCRDALDNRVGIANAAARGLSTAGRIVDGLGRGAGVSREDQVDYSRRGTVSSWGCCFTSAKDVNIWAGPLLELLTDW